MALKRIPVKIISSGQTGTIDTKDFDPTTMEISGPLGFLLKSIPIATSLAGAGGGGLAAGPVGVFGGGAAGYGGGKAVSRSLEDLLTGGISRPSNVEKAGNPGYVGQQMGGDANSSALAGATELTGYQALKSLLDFLTIAKGPKNVGNKRELLIKKKGYELPREQTENAVNSLDPNKYTSGNQALLSDTKGDILRELFPVQDVAPAGLRSLQTPSSTGLNRAYGIVNQLEADLGVKYGGNTPAPVKDIFGAIRGVPNELYPDVAKMNKLYQKAIESKKYSDLAKGSVAKFALYKLLGKIIPGL